MHLYCSYFHTVFFLPASKEVDSYPQYHLPLDTRWLQPVRLNQTHHTKTFGGRTTTRLGWYHFIEDFRYFVPLEFHESCAIMVVAAEEERLALEAEKIMRGEFCRWFYFILFI